MKNDKLYDVVIVKRLYNRYLDESTLYMKETKYRGNSIRQAKKTFNALKKYVVPKTPENMVRWDDLFVWVELREVDDFYHHWTLDAFKLKEKKDGTYS